MNWKFRFARQTDSGNAILVSMPQLGLWFKCVGKDISQNVHQQSLAMKAQWGQPFNLSNSNKRDWKLMNQNEEEKRTRKSFNIRSSCRSFSNWIIRLCFSSRSCFPLFVSFKSSIPTANFKSHFDIFLFNHSFVWYRNRAVSSRFEAIRVELCIFIVYRK